MTYKYKEKPIVFVYLLTCVALDTFFVSWVLMKTWNNVMVDVFNIQKIGYTSAIILRFGYSALTYSWFSCASFINLMEWRFEDYANMVSTRFEKLSESYKLFEHQRIQVPYVVCINSSFNILNKVLLEDSYLASCIVATCVNLMYVYASFMFKYASLNLARNLIALLVSQYIHDTFLNIYYDFREKYMYLIHHIAAITLLVLHAYNILPISIGFTYLNLIEYSNVFVGFFHICNQLQWKLGRSIFAYPLFISYVPLRLFVLPYYSLSYKHSLLQLNNFPLQVLTFNLLLYVNVFSMYFAVIMVVKFIEFHKKLLEKMKVL